MLRRCRGPVVVGAGEGNGGGRRGAERVQGAGTAHGPVDPSAERRAQELGPGETQVVPGKGESVVLPETVADELRADVQEDAGVRGADREPDRPDERVLGPLYRGRQERRQEQDGQDYRERH